MIILILQEGWEKIAKQRVKVGRKKRTRISKVMIKNLGEMADRKVMMNGGVMYQFKLHTPILPISPPPSHTE